MTFNFTTHKYHLLFFLLLISLAPLQAQTKDPSAILQLNSTTQGFLPPRMTTAERDAIANPADGLMIFNTTSNHFDFFQGTQWYEQMTDGLSTQFRDADGDTYLDVEPTIDADRIEVFTANSLRMLFATNGSIGIGTATPTANLHIDGGSATTDILSISENGTELLEIDNNGKLDFKTTNQGIGLPVLTTAQRNAIASPQNGDLIFNDDTNKMELYNLSAALWEEAVDNGLPAGFTHNGAGLFGINTNDYDANRLSINGNLDFISANNHISWGNDSDTRIYANATNSADLFIDANDDLFIRPDDDIFFRSGNTDVMFMDGSNRRLGIRNTSPAHPLDVSGVVRSRGGGTYFLREQSSTRRMWIGTYGYPSFARGNISATTTNFNTDAPNGFNIEVQSGEGAGIHFNGDNMTIWNPGDSSVSLRWLDEDANSTGWRINTTGSFNTFSDRRLKTNIRDANIPIDYTKLTQLKLQAFSYIDYVEALKKDDGKSKKKTARLKEKTQSIGYIAQDLKAVFPNAVMEDTLGEEGYLLLDHNQLLYSMLEVIANQEKRMQEMAIELDFLRNQIENLK